MKSIASFIIALLISYSVSAQNSQNFLNELAAKVETYATTQPNELCYLQTNDNRYAAGDRVWFTAFVYDNFSKTFSVDSKLLIVKLLGRDGSEICGGKFEIENAVACGSVTIAKNTPLGEYLLVAYPSNVATDCVDKVFYKTITVEGKRADELQKVVGSVAAPQVKSYSAHVSARLSGERVIFSVSAPEALVGKEVYFVAISRGEIVAVNPITLQNSLSFAVPSSEIPLAPLYLALLTQDFEIISQGVALRNRSLLPTELSVDKLSIPTRAELKAQIDVNSSIEFKTLFIGAIKEDKSQQSLGEYMTNVAYNDFDWNNITKVDTHRTAQHAASIGGIVTKDGNPAPDVTVNILNKSNRDFTAVVTDKDGRFYVPIDNATSDDFNIALEQRSDAKRFKIALDKDFSIDVKKYVLKNFYGIDNKDIKDNSVFEVPLDKIPDNFYYASYTNMIQLLRSIRSFDIDGNIIVFPGTRNSVNSQTGALIVLDGAILGTNINVLDNILPANVEKINISTSLVDIQKYTGFNNVGVIEITSLKKGIEPLKEKSDKIGKNLGVVSSLEIYPAVDYSTKGSATRRDERATLVWNATVDVINNKTSCSIWSSDVVGNYVVLAEGVTPNGEIVSAKANFTVE